MGQNHSKNRRQERHNEAIKRAAAQVSAQDQISKIDYRCGENQGAQKERARLAKVIREQEETNPDGK